MIGAGVMGADIAGWCVVCGMEVTLQDLDVEQIAKGSPRQGPVQEAAPRPGARRRRRGAARSPIRKGDDIARADVVIEAIVEKLEIKQKLFVELEAKLKPGAVLATNTSSIKIEDIAEPLPDPGAADRPPLLQSGGAAAAGRGDPRRADAR